MYFLWYPQEGAWPVLIDDFVEYARPRIENKMQSWDQPNYFSNLCHQKIKKLTHSSSKPGWIFWLQKRLYSLQCVLGYTITKLILDRLKIDLDKKSRELKLLWEWCNEMSKICVLRLNILVQPGTHDLRRWWWRTSQVDMSKSQNNHKNIFENISILYQHLWPL